MTVTNNMTVIKKIKNKHTIDKLLNREHIKRGGNNERNSAKKKYRNRTKKINVNEVVSLKRTKRVKRHELQQQAGGPTLKERMATWGLERPVLQRSLKLQGKFYQAEILVFSISSTQHT